MKVVEMRITLRTSLFAVALGLSAAVAQAEQHSVPLFPFDSADDVSKWTTRASTPATQWLFNRDPAFIKQGTGSVHFTTPSAKSGSRWPAAILDEQIPVPDMRRYDKIILQAFNPQKVKQTLHIHFILRSGARITASGELPPGPGWHELSFTLPAVLTRDTVKALHFFQSNPPADNAMYLDDVRLAVDPELMAAKIESLRSRLNAAATSFAGSDGAAATLSAYETRLGALQKTAQRSGGLLEVAGELVTLDEKLLDLLAKLNAQRSREAIARFDESFGAAPMGYAWQNGATKVIREGYPFTGTIGGRGRVALARNEREGIQLVLRGRAPAKNVRVEVSPLTRGDSGETLASEQVAVLPVGYVDLQQAPYVVDRLGWTADPLLDFLPAIDIEANVWQPVWLDVHAPADAAPGVYSGTVTVHVDGLEPLSIPFEVEVWAFELPRVNSMPTAITHSDGTALMPYYNALPDPQAAWKELETHLYGDKTFESLSPELQRIARIGHRSWDMLVEHRIMPDNLYNRTPTDFARFRKAVDSGSQKTNVIYVGPVAGIRAGDPYPEGETDRYLRVLDDYVKQLTAAGLLDKAYVYAFDEIGEESFFAARDILSQIKSRHPELQIITTAKDNTFGKGSGLHDYVDAWVPLTPDYVANLDGFEELRREGKQVWWYVCAGPLPPSANMFPDQPATAPRLLMGFLAQKYRPDGFLYYQTSNWIDDPIVTRGPLTNQSGKSAYLGYNGDGMLFYPGPDGPLSCIRLKALRDGVEDYEYCKLLEQAVAAAKAGATKLPAQWITDAEAALNVPAEVADSLTTYTHEGAVLLGHRDRIARLLDAYQRQGRQ